MKTTELMLGNYILYKKNIYVVKSISIKTLSIETFNGYIRNNISIKDVEDIQLNEDWLSKLGFDKIMTNNSDNFSTCEYLFNNFTFLGNIYDTDIVVKYGDNYIFNVHSLQKICPCFVSKDSSSIRMAIDDIYR